MRTVHCGRLDRHEPHTWRGWTIAWTVRRPTRFCPGTIVIEGGHGGVL